MSFESLLLNLVGLTVLLGGIALFLALRQSRSTEASEALSRGDFATALAQAETIPGADRQELYTAAVAAKHLLELDLATELLERILRDDPGDGEAWLELGLVKAYGKDLEAAEAAFDRVESHRSDLWESLTLHRAWLGLCTDSPARARTLFEEVEHSLETKLRTELGEGEPLFVEWFLQAAALWQASGDLQRATWAREMATRTAPESRLHETISGVLGP